MEIKKRKQIYLQVAESYFDAKSHYWHHAGCFKLYKILHPDFQQSCVHRTHCEEVARKFPEFYLFKPYIDSPGERSWWETTIEGINERVTALLFSSEMCKS